jgi:hypothetical protein
MSGKGEVLQSAEFISNNSSHVTISHDGIISLASHLQQRVCDGFFHKMVSIQLYSFSLYTNSYSCIDLPQSILPPSFLPLLTSFLKPPLPLS